MIFVTVGTDLPFDRMIRIVDRWAQENGRTDVFAQIGETDYRPEHIGFTKFLEPPEFIERFSSASVVVAHAGMGTILSALRYGKPILVMPRRASLGEQRNEHQLATAKRLYELGKISVAFDDVTFRVRLEHIENLQVKERIGAFAGADLLSTIRNFIHSHPTSTPANPRAKVLSLPKSTR